MRFVIGGADSGKRDFVRENYGIDEILMADYDSVLTCLLYTSDAADEL